MSFFLLLRRRIEGHHHALSSLLRLIGVSNDRSPLFPCPLFALNNRQIEMDLALHTRDFTPRYIYQLRFKAVILQWLMSQLYKTAEQDCFSAFSGKAMRKSFLI